MATAGSSAHSQAPAAPAARTRRPGALIPNIALWSAAFLAAVIVAQRLTPQVGRRMGPYWSGLITLALFIGVALYSVRKRSLWISIRLVRIATRIAKPLQNPLVMMDRLETWRAVHVTVGVIALLPFLWHMQTGLMSPLEIALLVGVILLFASGFFGVFLQQYFPHAMTKRAEHEVRLKDVDGRIREVYVQCEEKVLGHQEELLTSYRYKIKEPILLGNARWTTLLAATVRGADPGEEACREAAEAGRKLEQDLIHRFEQDEELRKNPSKMKARLQGELDAYRELLALATRKVNLEHNAFNLHLSTRWLTFHIVLSAAVGVLVAFHVFAALYFYGT